MDTFLSLSSEKIFKGELEIKKSRFLSFSKYVNSSEEAEEFLRSIKKEHQSAKHVVFAYRLLTTSRASDDGEPSGTAGKPILGLLEKMDLFNVVVVVVRYFGGIKLGAGPLLRAYVDSASQVLTEPFSVYEKCFKSEIELDFKEFEKLLPYSLKHQVITQDISFSDKVRLSIIYPKTFEKTFANEQNKKEIYYTFGVKNG